MSPGEATERASLVSEARTWLGTRYRNRQAVRGPRGGIDCALLLVESHICSGLFPRVEIEDYTSDWHLHRSEERYLAKVEEYLHRIDDEDTPLLERATNFACLPGDVLIWKNGLTFSHGAIVSNWPYVVHANILDRMVTEVSVRGTILEGIPMRAYSYWGRSK